MSCRGCDQFGNNQCSLNYTPFSLEPYMIEEGCLYKSIGGIEATPAQRKE